MTPREPWKPRVLRRFGGLFATGFALFYGTLLIGETVGDLNAERGALVGLLVYTAISAFVGWLNQRAGGAMLVVASVALASFVVVAAERDQVSAAALIGGPFLVAGLALLLAAGLHDEWRYRGEETDAEK
jgi:hypothetical protein